MSNVFRTGGVDGAFFAIAVIVLIIGVISGFLNSSEAKGERGEKKIARIVDRTFANTNAIPIKDLYLPWPDGRTAQIDELIIADSGIYVIEMKNYKGWIFGNEINQYWTQVLYTRYRGVSTKNRLYNPIRQNASHISCVRKNLK